MSNLKHLFQLRALPRAAMALAACGSAGSAIAQSNANTGKTLFEQKVTIPNSVVDSCKFCHSDVNGLRSVLAGRGATTEASVVGRINTFIASDAGGVDPAVADGMGHWSFLMPAQRTDIAAYILSVTAPPPPPPFAGSPPPVATPNTVLFNATAVGSTSSQVGILITNNTATAVTFATPAVVSVSGDTTDFLNAALATGTAACPAAGGTLAAGVSCSIGAQFKPTAPGARTATWAVNFANGVASRTLTLSGTATAAPAPAPTPAPAPAPATSAANAPSTGGGGALSAWNLLGLIGLAACGILRPRRRNAAWPHSDS